jgi:hypothetical protein
MQLIETVTVGSGGAASIEFTGIPQDGTDLVLVVSGRVTDPGNTRNSYNGEVRFNNSTGGNYFRRELIGFGNSVESNSSSSSLSLNAFLFPGDNLTANTFNSSQVYITNYASSTEKSISCDGAVENNATLAFTNIVAGRFNLTAAIASLQLAPNAGTLVQHSTASLYKITKT